MPALPVSPPVSRRTALPAVLHRHGAAGALLAASALLVLSSFWRERFQLWAALLALGLLLAGLIVSGWLTSRRTLSLTLIVDVLLVFLYLWSLDDRIHVVIQATPHGFVTHVGADLAPLPSPYRAGQIGFVAGSMEEYRVQPTGEAFPVDQGDGSGYLGASYRTLADLGQRLRLATPKPAWVNIMLSGPSGRSSPPASLGNLPSGADWRHNVRGELEGDPGAIMLLPAPPTNSYTLSADLLRPDGTQGILVGIDATDSGYILAIRADQPDALWFAWKHGRILQPLGGTLMHVQTVPMIQRDVRLILGSAMAAFAIILLIPPAYLLPLGLLRLLGESSTDTAAAGQWYARAAAVSAGVLAVGALIATGLIASNLLQRMPHVQDSVAYLFQAKTLALGRVSVPAPRFPAFFTEEFIPVYHGQWFGKYPPGWPVLLAVGVLLHAPWLVNPVLSAANIVLIYLIGREVYGAGIGLLAAALTLSSPFFLFLGSSFMAHSATLFYLSAFTLLLVRWMRRIEKGADDRLSLVPAGFLLGMGFITRQLDAVAFAAPFTTLILVPAIRRRVMAVRWLVLGGAVPGIALLLYNWDLTGDPLRSPYSLWWSFDHLGFGASTGMYGFTPGLGFWNTSYNLEMLQAHLFGWPFYLTLAPALIPFILGRATRWDAVFGLSAGCVMVAYIFYWAPGVMYGPRYYYVAIPWFALLTARGLEELYRWPLRLPFRWRPDRLAALLVPTILLTVLLLYNTRIYLPAQLPVYDGYNSVNAGPLDAVAAAGVHHALVFVATSQTGGWYDYGELFEGNSPLLDSDVVYARDLGAQNRRLMRLYPGRAYYRLQGTQLSRIG
jgi:hypothetical protein